MRRAANLATAGHRVIACVRRAERVGELAALALEPTTDIADLFDCGIVVSMVPDDGAVRQIVFGREDFGVDGLAGGLMPGAIHLSMSTISMAAASEFAGAHARSGQGYVAAPVFGNPDKIARQHYASGGFVFPLAVKDVRLALAEAEAADVPMPSVSVLRDRLISGISRGYSEL